VHLDSVLKLRAKRFLTALLAEISEEWESGRIYLNMETSTQPSV
jgi:hypothetical protein